MVVYLPPDYHHSAGRHPVFYLQDGQNLFDPSTAFAGEDWGADATADRLIRAGAIDPVILVGIYHAGIRRISEYTPTRDRRLGKGGKADRYAMMLAREVKPLIDREYRTRRAAADTAVGGSSLGALASLEAGLLYPRVFGKLAVISPSVWWDERSILEVLREARLGARPRIWLDAGTAEGDGTIADLRLLRDALLERGWREGVDLCYREIPGAGHNEQAWGARFGDVLECLFPRPA